MKNEHIVKSLIFLAIILLFFLGICGLGVFFVVDALRSQIDDKYVQYKGSERGKEELWDAMDDSKAWILFFKTMYPEKAKDIKPIVFCDIQDKRYINALATGGDYLPGNVVIKMELKDLTNDEMIAKATIDEMLPPVVITGSKKDAQKTAYGIAENKAYKRIRKRVEGAVFLFMANYPEKKKIFMPIMAEYFGGKDAHTQYKAGEGLLKFGNNAVPFIVETTLKSPERNIICAKIISLLKDISPDNLPILKKLLNHPKEDVQCAAISVIGQFIPKNKKALDIVLEAAKNQSKKIKVAAVKTLGKYAGDSQAALKVLATLLADNDKVVQRHVTEALAMMGEDAHVIMIDMLDNSKLQKQLAEAIIRKSGDDKSGLFDLLIKKKKQNPKLEKGIDEVFKAWRSYSGKSYMAALNAALKSDDSNMRKEAFSQVLNINRKRYKRNRPNRDIEKILIEALDSKDEAIRKEAMQEILNDRFSTNAKRKVYAVMVLEGPKEERYKYIRKVSSSDVKSEHVPNYIEQLKEADDKYALTIIYLLTSNKDIRKIAIPKLIEILPNTSFRVRDKIIRIIAADKECQKKYLILMLKESVDSKGKQQVNLKSILYRAAPPTPEQVVELKKMLENDETQPKVKGIIFWLFYKMGKESEKEIPFMVDLLKQGKCKGYEYNLLPFFKLHGEKGIEGLAYCMEAKSAHARSQAYHAIKRFGAKAVPILKQIKTDNPKAQKNIKSLINAAER